LAKIVFSAVVGDARKKAGGVVFSKVRTGAIVRRKVSPVQPRSQYQRTVRSLFTSLSKYWGASLSDTQRSGWNALAAANPRKDVFGQTKTLTGLQLFQSCNRNLNSLGITTVLEDPPAALSAGSPGTLTLVSTAATSYVLTEVAVTGGNADYSYSSFTGEGPHIGQTVTVAGFSTSGNNVTGVITATTGGASGTFTLNTTTQVDETKAATATAAQGLTVNETTYNTSDEGYAISAAAQVSAGRTFIGKRYRLIVQGTDVLAAAKEITTEYESKFGALIGGKRVPVLVKYINKTTGASGTPSAATTIVS
jgi:hypothetical protein